MRILTILLSLMFFSRESYGLCVSAFQTRLRSEPSINGKITWVVGRYMPLLELERRGRWIKVRDLDGEIHWAQATEVSGRERCVVVKTLSAALRKGPSANSPLATVRSVEKYTAFKRIEADPENWYNVEDEAGGRYWISSSLVWRPTVVSRIGF